LLDEMQDDPNTDDPHHKTRVGHPVRASEHAVEQLGRIAEAGESPATPAILAGAVLVFIVSLAAILILLAFGIADFFS
jgi:hypothetical protein